MLLYAAVLSCNSSAKNSDQSDQTNNDMNSNNGLKVGGLYTLTDHDSSFYIVKLLVVDSFAVHLRTYEEKFAAVPLHINSDSLKILIGHAPISKEGFLAGHPKLINVEKVREDELEGYKLYLEEMEKESR